MPTRDMPDSPEANRLGCSCPSQKNGAGNDRGKGVLVDGIREWTINPSCKIHTPAAWWFSRRARG